MAKPARRVGLHAERIAELDEWILKPIDAMLGFGILRAFPNNPDERNYYSVVHEFATAMGVQFN